VNVEQIGKYLILQAFQYFFQSRVYYGDS